MIRRGETETAGRRLAQKILAILAASLADLAGADQRHMKTVIGDRRRHLAQRRWGDVTATRWRWRLTNRGHDPLRGRNGG